MRTSKITAEQRSYIREGWGKSSVHLMAAELSLSPSRVSQVAHEMGCRRLLTRLGPSFHPTPAQADFIRDNWGSLPIRTIAERLNAGVSYEVIRRTAKAMGLPRLRSSSGSRPVQAARGGRKPNAAPIPHPLPVIESDFIRPPTLAQLMAGK